MFRFIRQAFLWFFAVVGLLATIGAAGMYLLDAGGDPLDTTEIASVTPAPDSSEAAIIYLRHHADSSTDFGEVKRVRQPFPRIGASISTRDNVLTLSGGALAGWRSGKTPAANLNVTTLVDVRWEGSELVLCPSTNAALVNFAGGYFRGTRLCNSRP